MGYQRHTEDRRRNLTAKHAHKFNTSRTMADRKKAQKAGKRKHKTRGYDNEV